MRWLPLLLTTLACTSPVEDDPLDTGDQSTDADNDGYAADVDCNDDDPTMHPGAEDTWYDGIDSDCAGDDDFDADRDGYPHPADCNDEDPAQPVTVTEDFRFDAESTAADPSDTCAPYSCVVLDGELSIESTQLTSLAGLECVLQARSLSISDNPSLVSLDGLDNLVRVTEWLHASRNEALTDLNALSGFRGSASMSLYELPLITRLPDLSAVEELMILTLSDMPLLTRLDGLEGLTTIDHLRIARTGVISLDSLSNLSRIRELELIWNMELGDVSALQNITSAESLTLMGLTTTDLSGLENLTEVSDLRLKGNSNLTDLGVLAGLSTLDTLDLSENHALEDLTGLHNLYEIDYLEIDENDALSDLTALYDLARVGDLLVRYNASITDADVEEFLASIGYIERTYSYYGNGE